MVYPDFYINKGETLARIRTKFVMVYLAMDALDLAIKIKYSYKICYGLSNK